jgi:hypothetical protein
MFEGIGDLWDHKQADGYLKVITTNGFVKANGEAVMGAGCAREAKLRWPELPKFVGYNIKRYGNNVFFIGDGYVNELDIMSHEKSIITFPVKYHWKEKADLKLIEKSAHEIVSLADAIDGDWRYVLPRPGCGNGRLEWDNVKPVLQGILDTRFIVITK